jgi:hypothetical protein
MTFPPATSVFGNDHHYFYSDQNDYRFEFFPHEGSASDLSAPIRVLTEASDLVETRGLTTSADDSSVMTTPVFGVTLTDTATAKVFNYDFSGSLSGAVTFIDSQTGQPFDVNGDPCTRDCYYFDYESVVSVQAAPMSSMSQTVGNVTYSLAFVQEPGPQSGPGPAGAESYLSFNVTRTETPGADFDKDADVDGDDFLGWQRRLGADDGMSDPTGDANCDGDIDGSDLELWRLSFGDGSLAAESVPEPAMPVLPTAAWLGATTVAGRPRKTGATDALRDAKC